MLKKSLKLSVLTAVCSLLIFMGCEKEEDSALLSNGDNEQITLKQSPIGESFRSGGRCYIYMGGEKAMCSHIIT
ncbi:MAG: hypothetical protein R6V52_02170 [Bacteroidales bacterium]